MSNPNPCTLTRWVKGQSGNPHGKPPKIKQIPELIERFAKFETPENILEKMRAVFPHLKNLQMFEAVILRTYLEALDGKEWAVQFLCERKEGKVKDVVQLEGGGVTNVGILIPDNGRSINTITVDGCAADPAAPRTANPVPLLPG